ncbi:MAG: AbrB/MazE/SpoVT family DNA-binding domain-containing protein [Candidatus Sigynarchaeota archaeon]
MEARLSSKGQVVIPKELRDKLGLSPRKPLKIYEQDGKIIIESIVDVKDEDPWEGMEILDLQGRNGDEIIQEAMGALVKAVSGTDKE